MFDQITHFAITRSRVKYRKIFAKVACVFCAVFAAIYSKFAKYVLALLLMLNLASVTHAADINCGAASLLNYNGNSAAQSTALRIDENTDICGAFFGSLTGAANGASPAIGNDGANQVFKVRWEDAGFISDFRLNGVALAPNTNTILGAGTHKITYVDNFVDGPRKAAFTIDADEKTISTIFTVTNNAAPVIASNGGGVSAAINVAENQTAVSDVQTNDDGDAEGAGISYTLSGGADQALFNIDANTGLLTFVTAPDFETPTDAGANNVYDVQVTASDIGALTDVQDIAVTVTDVAEDVTGPTAEIQNAPASHDASTAFGIIVQFSEDVTGFVQGDVTVTNATLSNFVAVDANTFTVNVTPSGANDVTINIVANVAQDAALNGNSAATQITVTGIVPDTTAPSVEILDAPQNVVGQQVFSIAIEFSENVTGFTLADISVGNGAASSFVAVDQNSFTANITPTGNGSVTIDVAANVAQDAASNGNVAAEQVSVSNSVVEDTRKVIASFMTNRAAHLLANQPNIGGLLDGSSLSGGGDLGNLNFVANRSGMQLAFSSSLSRVMNKSDQRFAQAFAPVNNRELTNSSINSAKREISRFGTRHADGDLKGVASAQISNPETAPDQYIPPRKFDVWTQIYGATSRGDVAKSDFWVGYFGAHYFVSQNFLIGGLVQVDWADETSTILGNNITSRTNGTGWMVGPYLAGRIPNALLGHTLNYEARIAWGKSDNTVTPLGSYSDKFETTRFIANAKIGGAIQIDDLTVKPELAISWFEETQHDYTDSLSNLIPQQTVSLGEIRFGPNFSKKLDLGNGIAIQPNFGISGVWNFGMSNNALQNSTLSNDQLRARFDAGIKAVNSQGWVLALSGYYDGVGADNYEAYGASAQLTIPIQ